MPWIFLFFFLHWIWRICALLLLLSWERQRIEKMGGSDLFFVQAGRPSFPFFVSCVSRFIVTGWWYDMAMLIHTSFSSIITA